MFFVELHSPDPSGTRLRREDIQWEASKWKPKHYGDLPRGGALEPCCHQAGFGACCHECDTLYHQQRQVGDRGCYQQCHRAAHALSLRVDWEWCSPLGKNVLLGCLLESPTAETQCGVSYTVQPLWLCAADHRGVHPASRRDHGAGAARGVQGRAHRHHPHPDQLQHRRARGKAWGC